MIRKLRSGEYRPYSRKVDPKTGKQRARNQAGPFSTILQLSLILPRRSNHSLSERGQDRPSSRRCRYRISALPLAASR